MLDKSLPYYNIIMKRYKGAEVPRVDLPEGYYFKSYEEGDETSWAKIMVSVGEFDTIDEALEYFKTEYLTHMESLKIRHLFICDPSNNYVATLTNWWNFTQKKREPSVHWVGVLPDFQGLGLGKAIVFEGMKRMIALEGDRDFYLHTQTWSYKAITIYQKAGYVMVKDEVFGDYINEYDQAVEVLKLNIETVF